MYRNLALVEDSPDRRIELTRRAADASARALGAEHPAAINARIQLAVLTPDPAVAGAAFADTCAAIPAWHDALRIDCSYEAAWAAIARGDLAAAASAMAIARGDLTAAVPRPARRIAAAFLEIRSDDPARIAAAVAALHALAGSLAGATGWWNRAGAGDALTVAGLGHRARGELTAATAAAAAALALYADEPTLQHRRAGAAAELAGMPLAAPAAVTAPGSR